MRLLWLVLVFALLYFGHQYWRDYVPQAKRDGAPRMGAAPGGPVRDWQQAPNALMDMQGAMGGGSGGSAKGMRDTVQRGLDRRDE